MTGRSVRGLVGVFDAERWRFDGAGERRRNADVGEGGDGLMNWAALYHARGVAGTLRAGPVNEDRVRRDR
ncbi:hypothetical protein F01_420437 [Burkholderia cenocepacia]|nr:hypothetical protein F01_420437 [Burkholderia cenocepacia]